MLLFDRLPKDFYVRGGQEFSNFICEIEKNGYITNIIGSHTARYYYLTEQGWQWEAWPIDCKIRYTVQQLREHFDKTDPTKKQKVDILNRKIWFGEDYELGERIFNELKKLGADPDKKWGYWNDCHFTPKYYKVDEHKKLSYGMDKIGYSDGVKKELTLGELFEEKVVGYKSPFDILDGKIEKGSLFVKYGKDNKLYVLDRGGQFLPKEIVEKWEPVYQSKEFKFTIGTNKQQEVIVKREGIFVGKSVNLADAVGKLLGFKMEDIATWSVTPTTYTIGCTEGITLTELKEIFEKYNSLQ